LCFCFAGRLSEKAACWNLKVYLCAKKRSISPSLLFDKLSKGPYWPHNENFLLTLMQKEPEGNKTIRMVDQTFEEMEK